MKTAANYLPDTNAVQACARRMRQKAWKNKTADTRAHGVSIAGSDASDGKSASGSAKIVVFLRGERP